jgi:hypothetical protein
MPSVAGENPRRGGARAWPASGGGDVRRAEWARRRLSVVGRAGRASAARQGEVARGGSRCAARRAPSGPADPEARRRCRGAAAGDAGPPGCRSAPRHRFPPRSCRATDTGGQARPRPAERSRSRPRGAEELRVACGPARTWRSRMRGDLGKSPRTLTIRPTARGRHGGASVGARRDATRVRACWSDAQPSWPGRVHNPRSGWAEATCACSTLSHQAAAGGQPFALRRPASDAAGGQATSSSPASEAAGWHGVELGHHRDPAWRRGIPGAVPTPRRAAGSWRLSAAFAALVRRRGSSNGSVSSRDRGKPGGTPSSGDQIADDPP